VGVIVMVALSCWRAELLLLPASTAMVLPDGHGLTLPDGMAPLDRAYLAASTTDFIGLYLGPHRIEQAGGTLSADADFKVFPVPAGLMLVPLRILPAQPATLHLRGTAFLNPAEKVLTGRQSLVFGLPCAIRPKRAACRYPDPLQKLAGR